MVCIVQSQNLNPSETWENQAFWVNGVMISYNNTLINHVRFMFDNVKFININYIWQRDQHQLFLCQVSLFLYIYIYDELWHMNHVFIGPRPSKNIIFTHYMSWNTLVTTSFKLTKCGILHYNGKYGMYARLWHHIKKNIYITRHQNHKRFPSCVPRKLLIIRNI